MRLGEPPAGRLPDGFAVRLDPSVQRRDGGGTLLGGSPLRLLRLSARARSMLDGDRLEVAGAASAELAARLLDAGMAVPDLPRRRPDGVTVVVPVRDRPAELARLLVALRADVPAAAVVVVDDGSAEPVVVPGVLRHEVSRGPAAARNTGLRAATTDLVAFVDSDCVPTPGWLDALVPLFDDPRLALAAPRITGLGGGVSGWLTRYEDLASALDMGPRPAAVRPLSAVSYVPSAALLARRSALGDGFDESMQVAEDVDLVWRLAAAGWRVRYEPAATVAHEHRVAPGEWLRRRAFYGTGAALLAARHGAAVAPVVVSPWSAAAWALLLSGRRGLLPAAAVLGTASGRLTRRLRRPGEPSPAAFATALVLRGTATAGTTLARAVTRHHWPLAVAAGLVSRRARRVVIGAALADAVLAWWPRRREIGPVRFAAARRLEDLAYGSGLWAGALRARDPRALLPASPPRF